jgi:hypothetical protein
MMKRAVFSGLARLGGSLWNAGRVVTVERGLLGGAKEPLELFAPDQPLQLCRRRG